MNRRPSYVATFAFGLLISALALWTARASSVQEGPVRTEGPGRYAIASSGEDHSYVLVIDTATGRCWKRQIHVAPTRWIDLGSPVESRD